MADAKLKIVIEAVNNAKGALDGVKRDLGGLEQPAKRGGAALDKLTRSLSTAAIAGAALKLGDIVYDLGTLGAEAERVEATFENVAGGSERAAQMLDAMKRATGGAKSEMELMAGATSIVAMGLAEDADDIANIARNVEVLGKTFGGTMQVFQLMMGQKSLQRVDSFGIGMEEAADRVEEFKRAGMGAGEAFDTAILELMNEKVDEMGGLMDDGKLAIDRMKASFIDLKTEIGKGLAPAVAQVATNTTDLIKASQRAVEEYGFWGVAADILVEGLLDVNDTMHTQIDDAEALIETELKATAATDGYAQMLEYYKSQQQGVASATSDSVTAFQQYTDAIAGAQQSSLDHSAALWAEQEAAAAAALAFYDAAAGLDEMNKTQFAYEMIDNLAEAGLKGQQLADATAAILTQFGLLTPAEAAAQEAIDGIMGDFLNGQLSAGQFADAVFRIKSGIDGLPNQKEVIITINEYRNRYNTDYNRTETFDWGAGGGYQDEGKATGGQFWTTKPTRLTVGEGGQPELVTVTPATQVSNTWNVNFQGMNAQGAVGAVRMLQALYGAR